MTNDDAPVLVAEDNPTNQMAMKALLNHFGVKADFVPDGRQAVEAVKARQYRLILMDLMMPGMDGFEATKEIRTLEYGSGVHTPIVAVTALDGSTSQKRCIEVGMDDYVSKPIDRGALKQQLERWLLPSLAASVFENIQGQIAAPQGINRQRIDERYGSDETSTILQSFLSFTDKLLESLKGAIETHDLSKAGYITHELKGSSLAVSAEEMVYLSRELEKAIQAEKWVDVVQTYSALVTAFHRVTEFLKEPVTVLVQESAE